VLSSIHERYHQPQASYINQQEVVTHALPMEVSVTVIKILIGKDCP